MTHLSLFIVKNTQYAGDTVERMDYCGNFFSMKEARKALLNQINILSKSTEANDMQPTMNNRDFFHFYVKQPSGYEEKRHIVISKVYKSDRKSIIMKLDVLEKIKFK